MSASILIKDIPNVLWIFSSTLGFWDIFINESSRWIHPHDKDNLSIFRVFLYLFFWKLYLESFYYVWFVSKLKNSKWLEICKIFIVRITWSQAQRFVKRLLITRKLNPKYRKIGEENEKGSSCQNRPKLLFRTKKVTRRAGIEWNRNETSHAKSHILIGGETSIETFKKI
jgi:hypothetical protein